MIDTKNATAIAQSLAPAARTAAGNGTSVDTVNMNSVIAVFEAGAITDGTHTPVLQESADNSAWTDVAPGALIGSLVALTANSVQSVGYAGTKRYLRARIAVTGATTGAVTSAVLVGGHLRKAP